MFSHVRLGIDDFARSHAFRAALASELGRERECLEPDANWAAWRAPGARWPMLVIGRPDDGRTAAAGNGNMVARLAPDRATVGRCHARPIASGGRDEGAPGLRPHDHPDDDGGYVRDPDGNVLCVVCHAPADPLAA